MGFMPIASTELFSALADPTRRAIFERLARAAFFHRFVLKDGLLRRMLFGRRGPTSSAQVK
jgi:DNA-binding transcriptional ArsR family regulator